MSCEERDTKCDVDYHDEAPEITGSEHSYAVIQSNVCVSQIMSPSTEDCGPWNFHSGSEVTRTSLCSNYPVPGLLGGPGLNTKALECTLTRLVKQKA